MLHVIHEAKGKKMGHKSKAQREWGSQGAALHPSAERGGARKFMSLSSPSSVYRGVSWDKNSLKWECRLKIKGGRQVILGYFTDDVQAARVFDQAAAHVYGRCGPRQRPEGALSRCAEGGAAW